MGISGFDGAVGAEPPWEARAGRVGMNGLSSSWSGPMSTRKESCFSFSAIVGFVQQPMEGEAEEEEEEEGEERESGETMADGRRLMDWERERGRVVGWMDEWMEVVENKYANRQGWKGGRRSRD